jgi:DNA-binding transcriptional LysR family regulator
MSTLPTIDDLRLIDAIAEHRSLGAAAAALHIAQPSASQRLATLERRLGGVSLFDRGPAGARPTRAGASLVEHAHRVLALLHRAVHDAQTAAYSTNLIAGTIPSLAPAVFAALDTMLPNRLITQRTDHGGALVSAVTDGAIDLAVVAMPATTGGTIRWRSLGRDRLVVLVPDGVAAPGESTRLQLSDQDIVLATYMTQPEAVVDRLARRGARVRLAASAHVALAIARRRRIWAVVPHSAVRADLRDGERTVRLDVKGSVPISLITNRGADPDITALTQRLAAELGLGAGGGR